MNVGLLGHGVVGEGIARMMLENAEQIKQGAGRPVRLCRVSDLRDFTNLPYGNLFTNNVNDIIANPEIDTVVECIGGLSPAGDWARRALMAGQNFITSNKQLVAAMGTELSAIAREKNVSFLYEASCGGGIPVLSAIRRSLCGNRILRLSGILNGTTNYILTRMHGGAAPFAAALAEAKEKGYAEADPTDDIEGFDARRKLSILAALCFGARFEDDMKIPCEGIRQISREDMRHAACMGRVIRLVAQCELVNGGGWRGHVTPVMLPGTHPLSTVSDVFNAVLVHGDRVGDVMFYGRGAGSDPTASAIVGDIIEAARSAGMPWHALHSANPAACPFQSGESPTRLFFRLRPASGIDAYSIASRIMPSARVSYPDDKSLFGEVAVVTHEALPSELLPAYAALRDAGCAPSHPIRYESA